MYSRWFSSLHHNPLYTDPIVAQKAFSYSMLSFSLLSLGWRKKNLADGMLAAFQIFHEKMPFTPTATTDSSFSILLHQDKGGGGLGVGVEKGNKLKDFSSYLN